MRILVCTDGQAHSGAAVEWALRKALEGPAEVTALYVIDPWLKKFHNELYAQGRRRYLEYVEQCLQGEAEQARREFAALCRSRGLNCRFKIRHGEPLREILDELRTSVPDLVVTGAKTMNAWGRFRSRNLPRRLLRLARAPVSVIASTTRPATVPVRSGS